MRTILNFVCVAVALAFASAPADAPAAAAAPTTSLVGNGNSEADTAGDQWPDKWGRPKLGGSWEVEAGNHFLRLHAAEPGKQVLL